MTVRSFLCGLLLLWSTLTTCAESTELTILSYHEIANHESALVPFYTVTPTNFVRQMDWLKNHGYHFVSVDDFLADRAGKKRLPEKAVLITFDDGYHSVYKYAFPILKLFHAPAVVALVGSWLNAPENSQINFDGKKIPRSELLSYDELHEMVKSGLIEIASHSYDLHRGLLSNPQGNKQPAATARLWFPKEHRYEDQLTYERRVTADLQKNNEFLKRYTGREPRIIVWPYGRYNIELRHIAEHLGMPIGLSLDDGPNTLTTPLWGMRRILVDKTTTIWDLRTEIDKRNQGYVDEGHATHIMHIDLDYIYDPDEQQQEKNLGRLLDRIIAMGVDTVYLQAFADPDGNGAADSVYFPNRHLPMRADLFNRTAWQISTRTPVKRIYAWMPLLAWQLPPQDPAAHDVMVTLPPPNKPNYVAMGYPRLSPFSARAQQTIRDIFTDLARNTPIDGILFHDDVTMSDFEDDSKFARKTYASWGLPDSVSEIRKSDDLMARWTLLKINYLDNLADSIADLVNDEQPGLRVARNMYAQVVLNPQSETWYSQSLPNSLHNYDYTAIEAFPYMEQATDPVAFYHDLVERVKAQPDGLRKTVFELQTVDWRTGKPVPDQELAATIVRLRAWGVQNIAYYPDDLYNNHPDPAVIRPAFVQKTDAP